MTISGCLSKKCQKRSIDTIALFIMSYVINHMRVDAIVFLIGSKPRLDVTDKVDISYRKDKNGTYFH